MIENPGKVHSVEPMEAGQLSVSNATAALAEKGRCGGPRLGMPRNHIALDLYISATFQLTQLFSLLPQPSCACMMNAAGAILSG